MKFSTIDPDEYGQVALAAEPGEYDAVRFPEALRFAPAPRLVDPDRLAVAATLLFGGRSAGRVEFPNSVSALCAAAIRDYLEPYVADVAPVDYVPRKIERGLHALQVMNRGGRRLAPVTADIDGRSIALEVARIDRFSGPQWGVDTWTIVANAFMFGRVEEATLSGVLPLLAMGVLFAQDLEADCLRVVIEDDAPSTGKIRSLLASAGLGLEVVRYEE